MSRGFNPCGQKIPWGRAWQPTPGFFPGESHGQRSLVGCSPWGRKESDMTERLSACTHTRSYFRTLMWDTVGSFSQEALKQKYKRFQP